MDKKLIMLYKTLVVGVVILFISIAVQPSIATIQPEKKINLEPKDYLFQTIINIANNPDVKSLLEQYNHEILTSDYDYKGVFSQLLFKKPRLLFSMLFTKPSITYDYLEKSYNKGIKITNILGEDKVFEVLESVEISNPKVFDELNNIILNDEELSSRIATLKEMNKEFDPVAPLEANPVVCGTLALILIPTLLIMAFYYALAVIFVENTTLSNIFLFVFGIFSGLALGCYSLMLAVGC